MSLRKRSYTLESEFSDFLKDELSSPFPITNPIQESKDFEGSLDSPWGGSTAYTPALTVPSSTDPYSPLSGYSKQPSTPFNSVRRRDPASDGSSKAGAIPCLVEGCPWLSQTPSEHYRHRAQHKIKYACTVEDCSRSSKGFDTIGDLNRHLNTVHKILVGGAPRVYRCFAAGCSKPEKDWPRKDNFRFHLKKSHPNGDMEELLRHSEAWWDSQQQENANTFRPSLRLGRSLEEAKSQTRSQESKADPSVAGPEQDYKAYCDITDANLSDSAVVSWNPLDSTSSGARELNVPNFTSLTQHDHMISDEGYFSKQSSRLLLPENGPTVAEYSKVEVSGAPRAWPFPQSSGRKEAQSGASFFVKNLPTSASRPFAPAVPTATKSNASTQYTVSFPSGASGITIPEEYLTHSIVSEAPGPFNDADRRAGSAFVEVEQLKMVPQVFEQPSRNTAPEIASEIKEELAKNVNATSQSPGKLSLKDESQHSDAKWSEKEAATMVVDNTSLDSLKRFIAAYENKFTNEHDRAALRNALRALSNISDSGPLKDIGADDHFETFVDGAGRPVFICRWPTCADRKRWWNLRSEVKKHVQRHLKPYGCTFDHCFLRFGSKSDWIRHERKRHSLQDSWRCNLKHPTKPHARNCDEVFLEKNQFFAHLEELHQVTKFQQINKLAHSQLIPTDFQVRYWCGFCKSVQENRKKGKEAIHARYDHIAEHISGADGRNMDDWVSPFKRGSSDSEELTSSDDENSELSESSITVADNPSTIPRRRAVREQMEAAELTISRKGLRLNEVDAEHTPAIASLSTALQNPRNLSPLPPRDRSTSHSSNVGSYDSEGEREFMGSAIDCGTIGRLSLSFDTPGDHELITSIVTELVQAYLQMLDYPHRSLRQCADGSNTSQSQRTANDSSSLSISRNSAPEGTTGNRKHARQEDNDDDLEEQDSPVKRAKLEIDESENKSFACPYSKYERARYSEMNTNTCEKKYRRCASSYLTDIPRLKQHLFRTHKRPDLYCGRCFGIFKTQHDLEEHSRVYPPCPLGNCPFPEKMTHDQRIIIQRRRDLKDQVFIWFYIYETLFPGSNKPSSPYVEVVSTEAASSFQQWYESAEIIANFRERFYSRIAEAFPDTSDQFRVQMIHEECLSELAWQRGPNFHIGTGEESQVDSLELPGLLPNSSGTGPSFETAGSTSYIGAHATTSALGMPLDQSGITEPQFAFRSSGVVLSYSGNNGTDATMQDSLPTLGVSSRSASDTFEELDKLPPHDDLQDQYDFSMMDRYVSDFRGLSGSGILTIDASDAEDFHAADMEDQTEDGLSQKQKGKRRAYS